MSSPSIWNPSTETTPAVQAQTYVVQQVSYATAGQSTFAIEAFTYEPNTGTLRVFVNGVRITGIQEISSSSFKLPSGASCAENDVVFIEALLEEVAGVPSTISRSVFTATAGQSEFEVVTVISKSIVHLNGVLLVYGTDYTETGTALTLVDPASAGDVLEVINFDTVYIADSVSATTLLAPTGASLIGTAYDKTQAELNEDIQTLIEDLEGGGLSLLAPLASPAFTGSPTAPTQASGNNSTRLATTAFVKTEIAADIGTANSAPVKTSLNASGSAPIYACRAWASFNGTGTLSIGASGNVSSVTDVSTGVYTVNFTTPMPDTNYSVALSWSEEVNVQHAVGFVLADYKTASSFRISFFNAANQANAVDKSLVSVAVFR